MAELPAWVYDLVMALDRWADEHPPFYVISATASDGYDPARQCGCHMRDLVPREVQNEAAAIRSYLVEKQPTTP